MPRLAHHVFFTLQDDSQTKIDELLAACKKYLDDHPGVSSTLPSARATLIDSARERFLSRLLHVIFQDRPSHDIYQTAPRHLQFIDEQKSNWKQVQVFDSHLDE